MSGDRVAVCDCGWKLPNIEMECKLRLRGPVEHKEAMKYASAAIEQVVSLGGVIDVISIAHVRCPSCGARFSQEGICFPGGDAPASRVLQ